MASIYVLGAGAMGSLWATHLHLAFMPLVSKAIPHHSVQFLSTRKAAPERINLTLTSPFILAHLTPQPTKFDIEIPVVQASGLKIATRENPNIILLCTKSYHAVDAVLHLKHKLNEYCYLVLFQNGLGSQHKILGALPTTPIFAAVSTEGVNKRPDGKLTHAGKGLTRIGPLNDKAKNSAVFEYCINALTHNGLDIEVTKNIWQALWEKLAINCAINPFTAILNCANGEIKSSELFKENWPSLKVELTSMLIAADIKITTQELEQRVFSVIESTQHNVSSMLQDVRAKRKTEIEDINGFAVEYLRRRSLDHNINEMLSHKVSSLSKKLVSN